MVIFFRIHGMEEPNQVEIRGGTAGRKARMKREERARGRISSPLSVLPVSSQTLEESFTKVNY